MQASVIDMQVAYDRLREAIDLGQEPQIRSAMLNCAREIISFLEELNTTIEAIGDTE